MLHHHSDSASATYAVEEQCLLANASLIVNGNWYYLQSISTLQNESRNSI